jgi:hypothetical protein
MRRNPYIDTVIGRRIESTRVNRATPEALAEFYDRIYKIKTTYKIYAGNI